MEDRDWRNVNIIYDSKFKSAAEIIRLSRSNSEEFKSPYETINDENFKNEVSFTPYLLHIKKHFPEELHHSRIDFIRRLILRNIYRNNIPICGVKPVESIADDKDELSFMFIKNKAQYQRVTT